MKAVTRIFLISLGFFMIQCSQKADKPKQKWLLETVGHNEFAISRTYLDDFEKLSPAERVKLYYLSRAAIAGRDIYYDQRHSQAVKVRRFFENLVGKKDLPKPLRDKVNEFLKLIWINNSHYHARTGLKLKPAFTYEELKEALPGENIEWLKRTVFDQTYQPVLTNLTPENGGDILLESATNIYAEDISLPEIEALKPSLKTKLNVRFAKVDGKIEPQVYKISGRYSKELSNIVYFLKKAAEYSEGNQKEGLKKLIEYYQSGDEELFRQASIHWLKSHPTVDTINGFIESYMDPRQTVGSWEGIAYYTAVDPLLKAFSDNVQYFEDHMPWDAAYKRQAISSKPVATLINVATAIGEGGPVTWSGINLPNYQDIRAKHGSKNVVLANMIEARNQVSKDLKIREFYLPEYQDLMKRHYKTAYRMLLYMHEVIGHGSGKAASHLTGDPRNYIGQNYGAWEEARASLVAWHYITDPKLIEMGAFTKEDKEDVVLAFYLRELTDQLVNLRNAKGQDVLREAHDRADQMIFEYIRKNHGGFDIVNQNGKFYVKITDVAKIHKGASELLKIVHEAKATGDKKTVDEYLAKYGNRFNVAWRDNVIARAKKIGLPELVAMVFPKMIPVIRDDRVVDVTLANDETFFDQQMRYGRISGTTEVSERVF